MIDYPYGRTKMPIGKISITEAMELTTMPSVRYFAISNAETGEQMRKIKVQAKIIPKIETKKGVTFLKEIVREAKTDTVMLDAEDLWRDSLGEYQDVLKLFWKNAKGIKVLKLKGVIFE